MPMAAEDGTVGGRRAAAAGERTKGVGLCLCLCLCLNAAWPRQSQPALSSPPHRTTNEVHPRYWRVAHIPARSEPWAPRVELDGVRIPIEYLVATPLVDREEMECGVERRVE